VALHEALRAAEASLAAGERDADALRAAALAAMRGRGVEPEYLELVATSDLRPVARVEDDALLAVAARVGRTRLIDNTILRSNGQPGG
jgi:pantoate--beta-alanine ligase